MIRAIETPYNGILYRSRLEARWAAFFDHLGVEAYYEYEGFKTEHGNYLPDFWLPQLRLWVEIKGANTMTQAEYIQEYKMLRCVAQATKCRATRIEGFPHVERHNGAEYFHCDHSATGFTMFAFQPSGEPEHGYHWFGCENCSEVSFEKYSTPLPHCPHCDAERGMMCNSPRLIKATKYASNLRFGWYDRNEGVA
jgi:hypothetical protein